MPGRIASTFVRSFVGHIHKYVFISLRAFTASNRTAIVKESRSCRLTQCNAFRALYQLFVRLNYGSVLHQDC